MKKKLKFFAVILIALALFIIPFFFVLRKREPIESKLTIYTYDSLLADPGYDFIGAFANHSGISKDSSTLSSSISAIFKPVFSPANTSTSHIWDAKGT